MSRDPIDRFDAVILGGGPAGSATALALARAGRRVLIIDRAKDGQTRVGETLPPRVRVDLERLGLWQDFLAAGHLRSHGIRSCWGQSAPVDNPSLFDPYGTGWHIDRKRFDQMIRQAAVMHGANLRWGVKLDRAESLGPGWRLHFQVAKRSEVVLASVVIDASGRPAIFARYQGVPRYRFDRLVGVVGYLERRPGSASVELIAQVEAVEDGWWYSAPIPDGRMVVAFMSDADLLSERGPPSVSDWLGQLRRAKLTCTRTNGYAPPSFVRAFPSESSVLSTVAGSDWIAVGDAAAGHDPLSGQGISRSLRDGPRAARAVVGALEGEQGALDAYRHDHAKDFIEYFSMWCAYYQQEQRWSGFPFWARRHYRSGLPDIRLTSKSDKFPVRYPFCAGAR